MHCCVNMSRCLHLAMTMSTVSVKVLQYYMSVYLPILVMLMFHHAVHDNNMSVYLTTGNASIRGDEEVIV